jgi:transcriptional regulator GlxA family with amidase domain
LDELDVVGPFEVLRLAARLGAPFETDLVSLGPPVPITAQNGLRLTPSASLDLDRPPDVLIVPGGGWIDRAPAGAWAEVQRGVIPPVIARVHEKGAVMAAVCTGAMLLAAAGILRGRAAVTHHRVLDELKATAGVEVVSARVVDDGNVVTAGGVTSGIDLALWLVERFASARIARAAETILEFERRGTVWRRDSAR